MTVSRARAQRGRPQARGLTLVEVVVFIVILAVVVTGLVAAFAGALRLSGTPQQAYQALQLAQGRTELILGQKKRLGFGAFTASFDPCATATPEACLAPTGYTVSAALAQTYSGGDANYRTIVVTVVGPDGGQLADIRTLVANNES